ncbi:MULTISPECIES: sirohydrochlorin chelatase [Nocardia]|uniref:sirohydrochlorin chelatase n=1 Tax=Nocardia TaxID=1817 RepID=UPI0006FFD143|nr:MULTISPECIES: sirohydrochlorin chelatase [Nocardia]KQY31476.1 cobalamin biosynthesis protein [Nocardia sp. Root136]
MYRLSAPPRGAVSAPRGAGGPALIAVAHGSRDPRSAATMAAVVAEVAAARPDIPVRLAFLDLSAPSVDEVVDDLAAQGHTDVIVVPLLLGSAFHARVDLPALLADATRRHSRLQLTQAPVLGPDPLLISALADRVATACRLPSLTAPMATDSQPAAQLSANHGSTATTLHASMGSWLAPLSVVTPVAEPIRGPSLGIAVAAVGSRDAAANRRTAVVARRLAAVTGCPTEICFATVEPGLAPALDRLRARGAERIVVAPWFLAPGLLTDRLVAAAPEVVHADVIGAHTALVDVIWTRYDDGVAADLELSA